MSTAAVITISDSRSAGSNEDAGGPVACDYLTALGLEITQRRIIPDDAHVISSAVSELANEVSLILTTGGTGVGPRDVTPEAVQPLLDRELPGFGEIMRTGTFDKTPLSIISRGGGGIIGKTLVVMLPGSPKGIRECLDLLGPAIKHVIKVLNVGKLDCQGEGGAGEATGPNSSSA